MDLWRNRTASHVNPENDRLMKTVKRVIVIDGVGLLAAMIVIRTMLGWTTVLEINGQWP